MKIYAPVKDANGIYASVLFVNGVGETDNQYLIEWFKQHGYRVEGDYICESTEKIKEETGVKNAQVQPDFESMTPNDLRDWMREHGYGAKIKNTKSKDKLIEILRG